MHETTEANEKATQVAIKKQREETQFAIKKQREETQLVLEEKEQVIQQHAQATLEQ